MTNAMGMIPNTVKAQLHWYIYILYINKLPQLTQM